MHLHLHSWDSYDLGPEKHDLHEIQKVLGLAWEIEMGWARTVKCSCLVTCAAWLLAVLIRFEIVFVLLLLHGLVSIAHNLRCISRKQD